MTNVVNLSRFRKKKTRAEKEKQAKENRAKFGRTKADKKASKDEEECAKRRLDGHEMQSDDQED